jgi:hypothetical protein
MCDLVAQSHKVERGRRTSRHRGKIGRAVSSPPQEIVSPELVLVAPPELAARARAALPDYAREHEQLVARARSRAALAQAATEEERRRRDRRLVAGSVTFTMIVALNCLAPLVLLILARR